MRGERRGTAGRPRTRAVSILNLRSGLSRLPIGGPSKWANRLAQIAPRTMECDDARVVASDC